MPILRGGFTFGSKYSAARSSLTTNRTVYTEVRTAVCGSNVQWRGRSYAASVPSELPKSQKGRKKVSKDERRAMVESFVNKYRATNEEKFPTSSAVKKEVGGSYYFVRKIIQELEYKSKISSSISENVNLLEKDVVQENESLTEAEVLSKAVAGTQNDPLTVANNVETNDTIGKHPEADGELQTSTEAEKTSSEGVIELTTPSAHSYPAETQSNLLKGDHTDISHQCFGKLEDADDARGDNSDFIATEGHPLGREIEKVSSQYRERPEDGRNVETNGGLSEFVVTNSHLLKRETEEVSDACSESTNADKEQTVVENLLKSNDTQLKGETEEISKPCSKNTDDKKKEQAGDDKKEQTVSEHLLNSVGPENKSEQYQGSPELETCAKDTSERRIDDAELPKKSTLWGTLKSFADDIISFWRKQ